MYRTDLIKEAVERESVNAIAKRSGVSFDTVSRACSGENLSVESLAKIATSLGLKLEDLFSKASEEQAIAA